MPRPTIVQRGFPTEARTAETPIAGAPTLRPTIPVSLGIPKEGPAESPIAGAPAPRPTTVPLGECRRGGAALPTPTPYRNNSVAVSGRPPAPRCGVPEMQMGGRQPSEIRSAKYYARLYSAIEDAELEMEQATRLHKQISIVQPCLEISQELVLQRIAEFAAEASRQQQHWYIGSTASPQWRWTGGWYWASEADLSQPRDAKEYMPGHKLKYGSMHVVGCWTDSICAAMEKAAIVHARDTDGRWWLDNKADDARGLAIRHFGNSVVYVCTGAALKNVVSTVTNDKGLYHKSISEACEECEEVLRATVPVSTTEDQLKKRMEIVGKARDDSASIVGVLGLHMDGIALLKQADSITACRQHRVELKQKILDATATLSCSGGTLCSDMKGLEEQLGRLQHVRDQVSPLLAGVAEEEVLACELGPFLRNWAAHAETVGKSFMAVFVEFCTRRLDDPEADLCAEGDALALAAKALDEFQKDDRLQCLDVSRFTGAAKSWQETWPTIDLVIRGKVAELSQAQVQQLHNRDVVTFESLGVAPVSVKAFHQKYVEKVLDPTADALEQAMAKPLENLVGVFKKFSSTRVLAVPLLKETFKDVAESVFTEEFVSHATTLVEGVASKQLRCKIDGLRRWMLCCQAAVKLHVLSEEAQNLTVEGLSQETTNPLFQALSTLAEATRSNEQFVNAQEAASALDALSALVVAGLDVIVDFGAMHREVVRFYDESASMLFERWAASSAGLVRQLTAAMPSEKTLKEPNVITDDTLRKSVVDNPDKPKIPELIRQISLARAHVRAMEIIMAKRPFFDPEPTSRTVKLAKVAVGVDYFLTELATRPATDAGMENWREAIKAKLKLKKITLPMFYYETLDKAEPRRPAPEGPAAPATQDVRPVPDVQAGVAATAEDVAAAAEPTPSVGQNID